MEYWREHSTQEFKDAMCVCVCVRARARVCVWERDSARVHWKIKIERRVHTHSDVKTDTGSDILCNFIAYTNFITSTKNKNNRADNRV